MRVSGPSAVRRASWRVVAAAFAVIAFSPAPVPAQQQPDTTRPARPAITKATLQAALEMIGLTFTDAELDLLLQERGQGGSDFSGRGDRRAAYEAIRAVPLDNAVAPAFVFEPIPPRLPVTNRPARFAAPPKNLRRPANLEDVAFWPVAHLSVLIRNKQVTSVELTRMYLGRLARFDSLLHAVVSRTDSLALEQARRADREIAAGRYRGPLHGIPYGIKDLFAVSGYRTTWGAEPYQEQVVDATATVARKLEAAGAVLVAKLTTGALAMGDVWFGGMTRNPWNLEQGSSGSSAGPGSAVAAGAVPFAIGTETLGSIVSPSTRNGVTGLRPSFGRVSKAGAMALSWTMDKPGPMCRNAEDCAIVFDAIRGLDPADPASVGGPFPYDANTRLATLRIGYLKSSFDGERRGMEMDRKVLDVLREQGATLIPIELPDRPSAPLRIILNAEAAAAFDELTRSNRDSMLSQQGPNAWPNTFRSARFIPAVEYIHANRVRRLLQEDMHRLLDSIDVYVAPTSGNANLLVTNLTGHPCVAVPHGFLENGSPVSISFCGRMYGEAEVLAVAKIYQDATEWDERHPERFGGTPVGAR